MTDRIGDLRADEWVSSGTVFSEQFIHEHTEFESFTAFREQSPVPLTNGDLDRDVDSRRLDDYVADTTEFDTWEEMVTPAAEEEIVAQATP